MTSPDIQALTEGLARLEKAIQRLDAALAARETRARLAVEDAASKAREDAIAEVEAELREEAASATARLNEAIRRLESVLGS